MSSLLIASADAALRRQARALLQGHACFEAATLQELPRRLAAVRPALLIADGPMRQVLAGLVEAAGVPVLALERPGLREAVRAQLATLPRLQ